MTLGFVGILLMYTRLPGFEPLYDYEFGYVPHMSERKLQRDRARRRSGLAPSNAPPCSIY